MLKTKNDFGITKIYPWVDTVEQLKQKPFTGSIDIVPSDLSGENVVRLGQWQLSAESARKLATALNTAANMLEVVHDIEYEDEIMMIEE